MVDTIRCLSWDDLQHPQFYEKLLMSFNQKLDHVHLTNAAERPPLQPNPVHPPAHVREHDQISSWARDLLGRDNNNTRVHATHGHGEGPSTGHSISNPETTTQQSLAAAQYDYYANEGQYLGHNNYTTLQDQGQMPPRVPSPRTLSYDAYPIRTPDVPELGVNRASTDAIAEAQKKKRFTWGRRS